MTGNWHILAIGVWMRLDADRPRSTCATRDVALPGHPFRSVERLDPSDRFVLGHF